jgi:hypothetical protein
MSAKTLTHDEDLSQAITYYDAHNAAGQTVSYREAAKLFCVDSGTLYKHRNKGQHSIATNGGGNYILSPMQRVAIREYVKDQYTVGLPCSTPIVLSTVYYLCDQEDPPQPHPSITYIKSLIKSIPELYKVKCKLLDYKRRAVQDIDAVREWFYNYNHLIEQHNILLSNIFNFDETNVREGCPNVYEAWVPIEITEVSCSILLILILSNY